MPSRRRRAEATHQERQRADPRHCSRRPEDRPDDDVAVAGVGELVGDHRERLVLGQVAHESVVDDHPTGATQTGDVGVQGRRTPRRVRDEHVVDVHPLGVGQAQDLGPQATGGQRGEGVEQRLDHERVDEGGEQHEGPQPGPSHRRPGARPTSGRPEKHEQRDRGGHGRDQLSHRLVSREARPGLVAQAIGQDFTPQQHREGERQEPTQQEQRRHREHHPPPPRPAQPVDQASSSTAEAQPAGQGQRDEQRGPAPEPRGRGEGLGAGNLVGIEDRGCGHRVRGATGHRLPRHEPQGEDDRGRQCWTGGRRSRSVGREASRRQV